MPGEIIVHGDVAHGISEELRSSGVPAWLVSRGESDGDAVKMHRACHFPSPANRVFRGHGACSRPNSVNYGHMPIRMTHERDNVFLIDVHGTLLKKELDGVQHTLAAEISRIGPVRVLFVLSGFEGWERGADWNDLTFFVKHGDSIERMAIVGDDRWRGEALMFAGADLRKGPVEFFSSQAAADARAWLSA
jgi:hypothetical protein